MNNVIPLPTRKKPILEIEVYPSSNNRWKTKFALFPVKTEDFGWVGLQKYQALLYDSWGGGIGGGYSTHTRIRVVFRTSVLLYEMRREKNGRGCTKRIIPNGRAF